MRKKIVQEQRVRHPPKRNKQETLKSDQTRKANQLSKACQSLYMQPRNPFDISIYQAILKGGSEREKKQELQIYHTYR